MAIVATVLMVALAVGVGVFTIYSIERGKPWTREIVRAASVLDGHGMPIEQKRFAPVLAKTEAQNDVRSDLRTPAANDVSELVA